MITTISGVYAQIAIKIHGDDLDTLQRVAEQVKTTIQSSRQITPPVVVNYSRNAGVAYCPAG
ncbi:MAG: hypothetical protein R3C56_10705 [Pirellulaceae bacterium]